MAKKLAPLVIPAVIDTSGIDRGVNSIRNKLSRVQGGNVGGVGGGGGAFSGGVVPYGGSGAAAAAMAAAFGASIAQRNAPRAPGKLFTWNSYLQNKSQYTPAQMSVYNKNNFISRGLESIGRYQFNRRNEMHRTARDLELQARSATAGQAVALNDMAGRIRDRARQIGQSGKGFYRAATNFGIFNQNVENRMSNFRQRGGAMFAGLRQSAGVMAGLGFGVTQTYQAFTKKGIQNTFSDISGLNPRDYQTAANIKRRAMSGYGTPGVMQSFFIGAERSGGMQGVRGGGSMAEKALSTVAKVIGAQFEQATTAVFSPIQFFQNQFDPRKSYFTSQKRALQ